MHLIRSTAFILLAIALLVVTARPGVAQDDPENRIPKLVEQIEQQGSKQAFNVLAGLAFESEEAVRALARIVSKGEKHWPGWAAYALAKTGHAELACERLGPRLLDGAAGDKLHRAATLFSVGRESDTVIDALSHALKTGDVDSRRAAARVLCFVPGRVGEMRSAFEAGTRDEDWFVALCCRSTLTLGTDPDLAVVAGYVEGIKSVDQQVRGVARKGLHDLANPPTAAGPALIFSTNRTSSRDTSAPLRRIIPRDVAIARLLPLLVENGSTRVRQSGLLLCTYAPADTPEIEGAVLGALEDRSWQIRSRAVEALPLVTSDPAGAIKRLLPLLDAPLEEDGSMFLTKVPVRDAVIEALGSLGLLARDAESKLRPFLGSESKKTRKLAAQALVDIGAERYLVGARPRNIEDLTFGEQIGLLHTKDTAYRTRLVIEGHLREATPEGTPEELELLFVDSLADYRRSREAIPGILERMGPRAAPLVPRYIAKLEDADLASRALRALTAIGPAAAGATDAVLTKYGAGNREAARALARFGAAAVPRLMEVAGRAPFVSIWRRPEVDPPEFLAIQALGLMGAPAAPAVTLLAERALKGDEQSAGALGGIGPAAKAAAPLLLFLAERGSEHGWIRGASLSALGRMGRATPEIALRLRCLLEQRTSQAPAVARVLGRVAPRGDQRAIQALRAALSGNDPELRRAAAEGLCLIGKTEEALPVLLPELEEPFAGHQEKVLKLIVELGPSAVAAAPRLGELLSSEYTDMREGAARALRSILAER